MTPTPHLLSEQQIMDIAHQCDSDASDMSQTTAFAYALESAFLATLAQGVELEAVAYMAQAWNATGTRGLQFDPPPAEPSLADRARGVVYTPLVPLSTAQAAVAAERAPFVDYLKEGETPIQRLERERADMLTVTGLLAKEKRRSEKLEADLRKETAILDWLSMHAVNVRSPMPKGGSLNLFWASPDDEGDYQVPSDLRAQCLGAMGTGSIPSPAPAAEPAPKQWPFVESPGAFTKRLRDALFDLDQDLLAAVRNVLIENPPQLATISPLPAAADAGLAHELWSAAQLAPGEGVEDGVRRIAALLPAAAGVEERAGLVESCFNLTDSLEWTTRHSCEGNASADDVAEVRDALRDAIDRLASSAAQVPEDARDAARYRWLRDKSATAAQSTPTVLARFPLCDEDHSMLGGLDLDEAIDLLLLLGAAAPAAGGEHG